MKLTDKLFCVWIVIIALMPVMMGIFTDFPYRDKGNIGIVPKRKCRDILNLEDHLLSGRITYLSQITRLELVKMYHSVLGNRMPTIALFFFYIGWGKKT